MSEFLYPCEMEEKIKKKDKEYYIGIGLCFGVSMQKLKKSQK